jgi:hypothetical protein
LILDFAHITDAFLPKKGDIFFGLSFPSVEYWLSARLSAGCSQRMKKARQKKRTPPMRHTVLLNESIFVLQRMWLAWRARYLCSTVKHHFQEMERTPIIGDLENEEMQFVFICEKFS